MGAQLKTSEASQAPKVHRSDYFVAPDGGAVVEVQLDGVYTALMPLDVAEETAKRIQQAVDQIRG